MSFKQWWKSTIHGESPFEKVERLSKSEIQAVQSVIVRLQEQGLPSSEIITRLQAITPKLSERWKAERAYWTEVKRDDTDKVGDAGDYLGIEQYKTILSPHPCPICVSKTNNGARIFKSSEVSKSGYGHVPPFHPNCYCILIPVE